MARARRRGHGQKEGGDLRAPPRGARHLEAPRSVDEFELIRPSGERIDWRRLGWRDRARERLENTPRRRYGIITELAIISLLAFLLASLLFALGAGLVHLGWQALWG